MGEWDGQGRRGRLRSCISLVLGAQDRDLSFGVEIIELHWRQGTLRRRLLSSILSLSSPPRCADEACQPCARAAAASAPCLLMVALAALRETAVPEAQAEHTYTGYHHRRRPRADDGLPTKLHPRAWRTRLGAFLCPKLCDISWGCPILRR